MALGCLSQLSYDKVDMQRVEGPPPTIAGGSERMYRGGGLRQE